MHDHPYRGLPPRAFWKRAVEGLDTGDIADLAAPRFKLHRGQRIATAGSCFAQHIARHLRKAGLTFLDAEPPPPRLPSEDWADFGYGLYSARYGNIYTSRQLVQLVNRARRRFAPAEAVWETDGRFYDPFRPSIEPNGFASKQEAAQSQASHLVAVKRLLKRVDVFIFTLGLTECWSSAEDGAVYPICPGTLAGRFDPERHRFHNLTHAEVVADMRTFFRILRRTNPKIRFILTVSPVPLAATAMPEEHVLTATTYSKSVLRAAAGELVQTEPDVDYFPSYEIITSPPFGSKFFADNQRDVTPEGVAFVMSRFQQQFVLDEGPYQEQVMEPDPEDVLCDEQALERFRG